VGRTKVEPCDDCMHRDICKHYAELNNAIEWVKYKGMKVEYVKVKCKRYEGVGGRWTSTSA